VAVRWSDGELASSGSYMPAATSKLDVVTLGGVPRLLVPSDAPRAFRGSAFGLLQGLRPPQTWVWRAAARGWTVPLRTWPVRVARAALDPQDDPLLAELVADLEHRAARPLHVAVLMSQGRGVRRCGLLLGQDGHAEAFAKVDDLDESDDEHGGLAGRELAAMQLAEKLHASTFTLPEVLDEVVAGSRHVLVMEHLPKRHEGRHPWHLPLAIAQELASLHLEGEPDSVPAAEVAPVEPSTPGLAWAARFLQASSASVPVSVSHGDLAPWNIRYRTDDDRPVLLDWEHFGSARPRFADPAAMVYARWLTYGRQRPGRLARAFLSVGRDVDASPADMVAGIAWLFQRRRQFLVPRLDEALGLVVASLDG
jgi:hypothetical protein